MHLVEEMRVRYGDILPSDQWQASFDNLLSAIATKLKLRSPQPSRSTLGIPACSHLCNNCPRQFSDRCTSSDR